ncbi:sigma-70 family RNA polymerase sigma factor [Fodinicola feengrottensis]|uniref:SigE family RNA polymerase sigma factor n=1 Tax=Fodinicola feengrottensis TaxID=435914 RepID=A0ABP4S724_9ACTN|nr:sigma-70 family RNA polymerase sigma factor [Fodinicola feengrottensis]
MLSAYALTGDAAEAQDAVQEAFVRALARPGPVLAADSPEAWLRKVALNIARSRFRRRHRLDVLLRREPPPAQNIPGVTPDRLAVLAAIRRLPRSQAEAIALYHLADLSVDEVARTLGVPTGTVKARLSRRRAALATLLADLTPIDASSSTTKESTR